MRSLHITGTCNPEAGGPARSSQGLVSGLEQLGHEALLLSCTPGDKPFFKGVKRFACVERPGIRACRAMICRMIREFDPDLLYCSGMWEPYVHVAVHEAFRSKIPCVVAPRGCFAPWAMQHKRWKKSLAWWLYMRRDLKRIQAFHATSPEEGADIRRLGFRQPVFLVANAVEVPDLEVWRQVDSLRNGYLKNSNRLRKILFLGRIHFQKGLRELIEAWGILKPIGWQLEITGTDREKQQKDFIGLAKSLGLKVTTNRTTDAEICFPGAVEDSGKWDVYAQSDIFILPSYSENFGISIVEALYVGVPAVASTATPWQELEREHCGRWVGRDTSTLVSTLREMMALSDEERRKMGMRGRVLVERKYTWMAVAEQMRNACNGLLGGDCVTGDSDAELKT